MRSLWAIICRWWDKQFPLQLEDAWALPQHIVSVEDITQLGNGAEALLKNPVLITALRQLEAEILRQWRDSGGDEGEKREWLWLKLRTVDDLPNVLHRYVGAAKVEKDRQDLAALEKKQGKYR